MFYIPEIKKFSSYQLIKKKEFTYVHALKLYACKVLTGAGQVGKNQI